MITLMMEIGIGDRGLGAGGGLQLPTLEKFAKINDNRAEDPPNVEQNFRKQWSFYRAAPIIYLPIRL